MKKFIGFFGVIRKWVGARFPMGQPLDNGRTVSAGRQSRFSGSGVMADKAPGNRSRRRSAVRLMIEAL